MPDRRPKIPSRVEKRVWQEAHCCCAYCRSNIVDSLAIHHIRPWSADQRHEFEHLILLCGTCHSQADIGQITQAQLYAIKATFQTRRSLIGVPAEGNMDHQPSITQISHGDSAINVSARTVTFKGQSKRGLPTPRIAGTVSDDAFRVGYLQYLAHRFNAFKKWETGQRKMNFALIHMAYRRELGFAVKTTPMLRFDDAAAYLQSRIKNTKLGRILAKRDNRLFDAFSEFSEVSDPTAGIPPVSAG